MNPKYEAAAFAFFFATITGYAMLVLYVAGRLVLE